MITAQTAFLQLTRQCLCGTRLWQFLWCYITIHITSVRQRTFSLIVLLVWDYAVGFDRFSSCSEVMKLNHCCSAITDGVIMAQLWLFILYDQAEPDIFCIFSNDGWKSNRQRGKRMTDICLMWIYDFLNLFSDSVHVRQLLSILSECALRLRLSETVLRS